MLKVCKINIEEEALTIIAALSSVLEELFTFEKLLSQ